MGDCHDHSTLLHQHHYPQIATTTTSSIINLHQFATSTASTQHHHHQCALSSLSTSLSNSNCTSTTNSSQHQFIQHHIILPTSTNNHHNPPNRKPDCQACIMLTTIPMGSWPPWNGRGETGLVVRAVYDPLGGAGQDMHLCAVLGISSPVPSRYWVKPSKSSYMHCGHQK